VFKCCKYSYEILKEKYNKIMSQHLIESEIAQYYADKSVFITGATGFLGKVLVEKLLRSCPNVKRLYVLIRAKRGKSPRERLDELFNCELFDKLREIKSNFSEKVIVIYGDMLEPNLGISTEDEDLIIREIDVIIHSAATVRFDEPLKLAYEMNVNGVRKMINLAKKLHHLQSFVHVSTAYCNCDRNYIGEVVYGPKVKAEALLQESLEWMDNELVNDLTPSIIKQMPNTYTFTKGIAENVVIEYENELPITIVRPSIVVASAEEPLQGWIDNANGPTGIILASGKGLLRTMMGKRDALADLIPVDLCCNLIIAASWFRGSRKTDKCLVFNCTSGQLNPLNWGSFEMLCYKAVTDFPFENPLLIPSPIFTQSKLVFFIRQFFEQKIMAYIMDFVLKISKKKPL
jgi:alcohol-forming fatty acyl-CoA reductase